MQAQSVDQIRKSIVGRFLQRKREEANITQWDIARKLEYTTAQFVSNWERGISLPPLDALPKLAVMLNVSAKEFQDTMLRYEEEMLKQHKRMLRAVFKGVK